MNTENSEKEFGDNYYYISPFWLIMFGFLVGAWIFWIDGNRRLVDGLMMVCEGGFNYSISTEIYSCL